MFLLYVTEGREREGVGRGMRNASMKTEFARSHRDRPENWNRVNSVKIYTRRFLGAFYTHFNVKHVGFLGSLIFNARFPFFLRGNHFYIATGRFPPSVRNFPIIFESRYVKP